VVFVKSAKLYSHGKLFPTSRDCPSEKYEMGIERSTTILKIHVNIKTPLGPLPAGKELQKSAPDRRKIA